MLALLANTLPRVDQVFFIVIGAIIAICILIYFLIPVINKKQYQEMRDNLNKREVAFKAGKQSDETTEEVVAEEQPTEDQTEGQDE